MVSLLDGGGLLLLLLSKWLLLGSCTSSTEPEYQCGEEGVQIVLLPGYLGSEVKLQLRDEFGMGYGLNGCLSKCIFSTISPNGEHIFYLPYNVCLSTRKDEEWLLRVRLVGNVESEDIDLICPKPKIKLPRIIPHPHRPRSTKMTKLTTPFNKTLIQDIVATTLPSDVSSHKTLTLHKRTTNVLQPADLQTKNLTTPDPLLDHGRQTQGGTPVEATSSEPTVPALTTEHPDILPASQCIVPSGRIPCLNSTVSRATCLRHGCCYDPQDAIRTCYYGHSLFVRCFTDGYFRLILSRYVTSPPLRLASVVLGPGTCPSPTVMGDFLEYKGYLTTCSTQRFLQGRLVYELTLTAMLDILVSPLGSITRDSSLTVLSQCAYNSSLSLSLVSLVVSTPDHPSVTNSGELDVDLRISKGSSFSSFYTSLDFPLQIPLRELVFLEARLLQPSDPRLHLSLHHCWAAPSLDPASTTRWPLLYDGCPFSGDNPMTKLLPGTIPSSYQRFAVSAFTFIGFPNKTQVYFFCSVSVCLPSLSETCTSDCGNLTLRVRRSQNDVSLHLVSSAGPLIFQRDRYSGLAGFQHLTPALPGIIFAVAFLLVLLFLSAAFKLSGCTVKFRGHLRLK